MLLEPLIEYLCIRCKPEGGFAAFPTLPPTIQDSYYAVDLLAFLDKLCPSALPESVKHHGPTCQYLHDCMAEGHDWALRVRYYLFRLARLLGFSSSQQLPWSSADLVSLSYEDRYYAMCLGISLPSADHLPVDLQQCHCREVMFALLGDSWHDDRRDELADWLGRCQNGDGGFGFYPGTTSFVENSYFCLNSLLLLGMAPPDPEAAMHFLCSCQTRCGGFSRSIRAAPFLDASWYAIHALNIVDRILTRLKIDETA